MINDIYHWILIFSGTLINSIGLLYINSKILNVKIKWNNYIFFMGIIFNALLLTILYIVTDNFIRIIISFIILSMVSKIIFKKETEATLLSSFIAYIVLLISEILFSIISMWILQLDISRFQTMFFGNFISNLVVTIIAIFIISSRKVFSLITNLIGEFEIKQNKKFLILIMISLCMSTILVYLTFFKVSAVISLSLNLAVISVYLCIVLMLFKEYSNRDKLKTEYEISMKNVKNFESMLDIQRMRNHENDNNLISLKGMINKKNKEAINYIDSLLHDKKNDDQYLILKTKNIPTGGLQGLVYQKLLYMKEHGINYNVEISKEVVHAKIENISPIYKRNICTIVGIFIDNAIQEVEKYSEKLIGIYLYIEDDSLIILISNNYQGVLDISKFDLVKYSSKGEGHGYGLNIVKDILLKHSKVFSNERIINGNIFTQKLKMKI